MGAVCIWVSLHCVFIPYLCVFIPCLCVSSFHAGVSGSTQYLITQSAIYSVTMATVHGGCVHYLVVSQVATHIVM